MVWEGCPRGVVVHECREGCGRSLTPTGTPADLCRDGGPRRAGDACTSDTECSPAEPVTGPDGEYTPALVCGEEGRCEEVPIERCDGLDDTGDGVVDEGCTLTIVSTPTSLEGNVVGASISRGVDGDRLGVLFGTPASLVVLDESLGEVGRTETLSPSGSLVVGGREGFVVQSDALREGEPATDLHVIDREAGVLRMLALGDARTCCVARYADGHVDVIGPADSVVRRDATSGAIEGEVPLDRFSWDGTHRAADTLVSCDRVDEQSTWIDEDLNASRVRGGCGERQSREGPHLWTWDRSGNLTRWTDRAPTDGARARVGDLTPQLVVAGDDEAFAVFLRDRELVVVHGEATGRSMSYVLPLEGDEGVADGLVLGGRLVLVLNDPFTRRVRFVTLEPRP